MADDAEEKYLAGLTDNVVMENGQFVQYREELNEIYKGEHVNNTQFK